MAQLLSESSPVVSVFSNVVNHIQQNGFVIANNSTNPNTQIDLDKGGQIWVHDPSDETVGEIVDVSSTTGAFDISTSGAGGLIDGTTVGANTWYELGVIADSTGTNPPAVAGWTHTSTTDNTPTASSDLPTGYDLFRAMGTPGRTWLILTDANSNILGFNLQTDGWLRWSQTTLDNFPSNIYTNDPANASGSIDLSTQVPPVNCNIHISNQVAHTGTGGSGTFGLFPNASGVNFKGTTLLIDQSDFNGVSPIVRGIGTDQTITWSINTPANFLEIRIQAIQGFKAV